MTTPPELTNIQAIMSLERQTLERRSLLHRCSDRVSALATSPAFIVVHVVWFAIWIGVNALTRAVFDPYPFSLLTLTVALEAILLTCFLLMAQNRMTQQADHRAHLDLQINLLAEQELTAILTLQCLLAERAGIDVSRVERLDQLRTRTDVHRLAATIARELEAVQAAPDLDEADGAPRRSATREVGAAEVDNGTRGQRREP